MQMHSLSEIHNLIGNDSYCLLSLNLVVLWVFSPIKLKVVILRIFQ
jgi:hypothetical protein